MVPRVSLFHVFCCVAGLVSVSQVSLVVGLGCFGVGLAKLSVGTEYFLCFMVCGFERQVGKVGLTLKTFFEINNQA
ncbi:uncharacterized protein BO80DRAFT_109417 [Aspergillus ibericus CBS 121593]|uniref:Uncharacterized protein n=1 Tax=Aspergillus ibericus CBS 121593 TaxID=1448316 RepID=A0A395GXV1_9EURO|nr:hypothetical protein BO80DRAFT_109417 [Aspergillus ibericus CBS 121593]RAL00180.1 hypothetical protein BO80DRAFT_109417 [Aspergillus ibericus CBS 121593]